MKHILTLLFCLSIVGLQAQDQEYAIYNSKSPKRSAVNLDKNHYFYQIDTLELPFIDDFTSSLQKNYTTDTAGKAYITMTHYNFTVNGDTIPTFKTAEEGDTTHLITRENDVFDTTALKADTIILYDYQSLEGDPTDTLVLFPPYDLYDTASGDIDTNWLVSYELFSIDTAYIFLMPADNNSLWLDRNASINNQYGVNPPSFGVATMDAIDEFGDIYAHANITGFFADSLTSKPVNLLGLSSDDDVFLSFFYQPQGFGRSPEEKDSLVLEFKSDSTDTWEYQWGAEGVTLDTFIVHNSGLPFAQVFIPITDDKWLNKSFQFRFRNAASIGDELNPSFAGNDDHWNIDYIRLDKYRDVENWVENDIAISSASGSMIEGYHAIPWKHFSNDDLNDQFDNKIGNLGSSTPSFNYQYRILDKELNELFALPSLSDNISPFTSKGFYDKAAIANAAVKGQFSLPAMTQPTHMWAQHIINASSDIRAENDTLLHKQIFGNFYALDDGSAEAGYGINGRFASGAVAFRFKFLSDSPDTLENIRMHFVRTMENASSIEFYLTVWADNGGEPGEVLYQKLVLPEYTDELNGFHTYKLEEEVPISSDFYIGWTQIANHNLAIGFDKNTDAQSEIFYKIEENWEPGSRPGAPMVRPVFGDVIYVGKEDIAASTFSLYPNPANGFTTIRTNKSGDHTLQLKDISGKTIEKHSFYQSIFQLNTARLSNGVYFVEIVSEGKRSIQKLLVAH